VSLVSLEAIQAARERIAGRVLVTPTLPSASLSDLVGASVFCKYESLQLTGSFKVRGAFNHILSLDDDQRARGVIAASAGNHAQGVAYAASSLGVRSTIVMPENTPVIKVDRTRAHGDQVEIVLEGADLAESLQHAWTLQGERNSIFVHPYDDDNIIAGQGTAGIELFEAVPDLEAVVVPIGGGGLISGISAAIHHLRPGIDIYGVQTAAAPAMKRSHDAGELVAVAAAASIAEGIAVKAPAERNLRHVRAYVRDVVLVEEDAIEAAIVDQMRHSQIVLEGAGAAVVAAALGPLRATLANRRVALVLSGGNMDLARLTPMIERSLARSNRLVQLRAQIPDRPGGLVGVLSVIANVRGNVVHVVHDRVFSGSRFGETEVEVTLEVRSEEHERKIVRALGTRGYEVTHVGHMPHPRANT
jgi:threonine dehydratase